MGLEFKVEHMKGKREKLEAALRSKMPAVFVGIPATDAADRADALQDLAGEATGEQKKRLLEIAKQDVNNAQLLYIFSKGSPARNQPPREVLEPAIEYEPNKKTIVREMAGMMQAHLDGDKSKELEAANRAALAGQTAAREWFTNPANHWQANAASTIKAKGSDRPGIDTGILRASIVGLVGEDK